MAVNTISEDLNYLFEYLNAHMLESIEVLSIELSIAYARDVDVLIPKAYGIELVESVARGQPGTRPYWAVRGVTEWCLNNRSDLTVAVGTFLGWL